MSISPDIDHDWARLGVTRSIIVTDNVASLSIEERLRRRQGYAASSRSCLPYSGWALRRPPQRGRRRTVCGSSSRSRGQISQPTTAPSRQARGWVVPRKYVERVGEEGFRKAPVGRRRCEVLVRALPWRCSEDLERHGERDPGTTRPATLFRATSSSRSRRLHQVGESPQLRSSADGGSG